MFKNTAQAPSIRGESLRLIFSCIHSSNGGISTTSHDARNPTRNHNPNPNPYNVRVRVRDLPGEGAISEALPTPVTPRPRTVLGSLLPVLLGDPRDEDPLGTDNSALSHPLMHCAWGWGTVASVGGNAASSLEFGFTAIYVFAAVIGVDEVVSAVG